MPLRHPMRFALCGAVLASVMTAPAAMGAGTLYKWVDKNGNVTYQDEPPPSGAGQVKTMEERGGGSTKAVPKVKVVLYSIKVCDACDLVRHILQVQGVPFVEKNADGNVKVQAELKKVAGVLSVPVLTIGDQVLRGYDKQTILKDLKNAGFSTRVESGTQQSGQQSAQHSGQAQDQQQDSGQPLTREDLQGMTPDEILQAYRDAIARRQDNDLFQQDQGFVHQDLHPNSDKPAGKPGDREKVERIPEDEQIKVTQ